MRKIIIATACFFLVSCYSKKPLLTIKKPVHCINRFNNHEGYKQFLNSRDGWRCMQTGDTIIIGKDTTITISIDG